ncbi:MAG: hypothetical protein VKJ06_00440 [Vampirovibrionales bacterium]|nr:hypothetical protein [Vampirovibrionales bacterium]
MLIPAILNSPWLWLGVTVIELFALSVLLRLNRKVKHLQAVFKAQSPCWRDALKLATRQTIALNRQVADAEARFDAKTAALPLVIAGLFKVSAPWQISGLSMLMSFLISKQNASSARAFHD